jgi:hypothetical protein
MKFTKQLLKFPRERESAACSEGTSSFLIYHNLQEETYSFIPSVLSVNRCKCECANIKIWWPDVSSFSTYYPYMLKIFNNSSLKRFKTECL